MSETQDKLARLNELLASGDTGVDTILGIVELLRDVGIKPKEYDLRSPWDDSTLFERLHDRG